MTANIYAAVHPTEVDGLVRRAVNYYFYRWASLRVLNNVEDYYQMVHLRLAAAPYDKDRPAKPFVNWCAQCELVTALREAGVELHSEPTSADLGTTSISDFYLSYNEIPDHLRELLHKRFFQGCTYKELSRELGLSISQVQILEKRALQVARRYLVGGTDG